MVRLNKHKLGNQTDVTSNPSSLTSLLHDTEESDNFLRLNFLILKDYSGASPVAQWLRICLPMQGTQVRALVWEDPTCHGATRPREPQLLRLRVWSLCSATREAAIKRGPCTAMKSGPHLPQLEKSPRTETKTQHSHK